MSSWSKFTGRKWLRKLKISVLPFLLIEKQELTAENSDVHINNQNVSYKQKYIQLIKGHIPQIK